MTLDGHGRPPAPATPTTPTPPAPRSTTFDHASPTGDAEHDTKPDTHEDTMKTIQLICTRENALGSGVKENQIVARLEILGDTTPEDVLRLWSASHLRPASPGELDAAKNTTTAAPKPRPIPSPSNQSK